MSVEVVIEDVQHLQPATPGVVDVDHRLMKCAGNYHLVVDLIEEMNRFFGPVLSIAFAKIYFGVVIISFTVFFTAVSADESADSIPLQLLLSGGRMATLLTLMSLSILATERIKAKVFHKFLIQF